MSGDEADPAIAASARCHGDDDGRQACRISDEELEVRIAEVVDVDDRLRVMVIAGRRGQHSGVGGGRQRQ